MKKTRISALILASVVSAAALSGCDSSGSSGNTTGISAAEENPVAKEIADSFFPGDSTTLEAWKDTDRSALAAYAGGEDAEFFDIPFSDIFGEYMFYLVTYRITDDMSEDNADICKSYRSSITEYQTFEKLAAFAAEKEYGITEDTLTAEQIKEVQSYADLAKSDWASVYESTVSEKLGESATAQEITDMSSAVLKEMLRKCGLDEDIFYRWELNRYIQELMLTEMIKDIQVSDEELQRSYDEVLDETKKMAENDPAAYESSPYYMMVYIPDGTRKARHIYISFDDASLEAIGEAVESGDNAKKLRLIEAASNTDEIQDKLFQINHRLHNGEDFSSLQDEYSDDESEEKIVLRNSPSFPDEYKENLYSYLKEPGDTGTITLPDGIYIIQYSGIGFVTKEDTEYIKDNLRKALVSDAQNMAQAEALDRWKREHPYTINYELLKIDDPVNSTAVD